MSEESAGQDVIYHIREIGGLAQAIHFLYIVRNDKPEGMSPELIAQRVAILDLNIKLLRNRIKKVAREELIPLLEKWEAM